MQKLQNIQKPTLLRYLSHFLLENRAQNTRNKKSEKNKTHQSKIENQKLKMQKNFPFIRYTCWKRQNFAK